MTDEERKIIADFIARVGGASAPSGVWGGGSSVPATTPALPPIDREADAYIADQFNQHPDARYRLTQLAFVQEHALAEAQNRIKQMEGALQQAQQAAQQAGQQHQGGGFFSGLFGGGRPQPPPPGPGGASPAWGQGAPPPGYQQQYPPPTPQYPPNYNPGVFQRQGSGFLGSALTTAAGVAGGVLAGGRHSRHVFPARGYGSRRWFRPGPSKPMGFSGYTSPRLCGSGFVDHAARSGRGAAGSGVCGPRHVGPARSVARSRSGPGKLVRSGKCRSERGRRLG